MVITHIPWLFTPEYEDVFNITTSSVHDKLFIFLRGGPYMIRREVYKFFGIKRSVDEKMIGDDEVEELFIGKMHEWSEQDGVFVFYLIDNYRSAYSVDFKKKILSYFTIVLLNADLVTQNKRAHDLGSLILIEKILDENNLNYQRMYDCLEDLTELVSEETAMKVIIPIMYQCGKYASKMNLLDDFYKYHSAFSILITIRRVQTWFREEFLWGLADSSLFNENNFYKAFAYDTNCPCFLDGFLETFIYPKSDVFDKAGVLMNKSAGEINNIGTMMAHKQEYLSHELYETLLGLIKKDSRIKSNFLNYIILVVNKNKDREKMVYDYHIVMSDGFALNFNNLLAMFYRNIVQKRLFTVIDIQFMKTFGLKSICESEKDDADAERPDTVDGCSTASEKNECSDQNGSKDLSFATVIFFAKLMFANYSYLKFFEHIKLLGNEIYSLELILSEHENHSEIQHIKDELESKYYALNMIFGSHFFKEQEAPIVSFMVEFSERHNFYDLPSLYFEVIFQIQTVIIQKYDEILSSQLLNLIEKIMCSKIRNLHFKESVVNVLELRTTSLTKKLFDSLIVFYSDLHHFDEFMYDKYHIRHSIHNIITHDENRHIKNISPTTDNLRFVNFVVDDTENQLSSALNSIIKIKKYEMELKHTSDREEIKMLKNNILRAKKKAKNSFIIVDSSLKMIDFLVEECNILTRHEIIKKFVSILNCNLKMIVGPKCNDLHIKNPDDYNFRPKELLRKIVGIYLKMNNRVYLDAIVQDRSYFSFSLFKRVLFICETKYILGNEDLACLKKLVSDLELVQNEIVEDEDIVPDEFIDPITCDPMKDPVILLTSNITVDRSTFEAIMLGDQIDPFNRSKLDETKVRDNKEMKNKLDAYWKNKKNGNDIE